MKKLTPAEFLLYAAIVVLALAAVALVFASPADFVKNKVVYGGF
jgi:hypothetical protein